MYQWLWAFGATWSPTGFVLGLPLRGGFWQWSKWPCNMIHLVPCKNPCRLYIHLAFTYILRWSLERSVKRTWTGSAFSTNESAWSAMVTGSQSRVWSGPIFFEVLNSASCFLNSTNSSITILKRIFSVWFYLMLYHPTMLNTNFQFLDNWC